MNNTGTALYVSFAEKDAVSALGAKWSSTARTWFVPKGTELKPFDRWLNEPRKPTPEESFGDACRRAGLLVVGNPIMDGKGHRVAVEGANPHRKDGTYMGYLDNIPAGSITNYKAGLHETWRYKHTSSLTTDDRAELKRLMLISIASRQEERTEKHALLAKEVVTMLHGLDPVTKQTPYMQAKNVDYCAGLLTHSNGEKLYIPLCDSDRKVWSYQRIEPNGDKSYKKDSRKEGCFFMVGSHLQPGNRVFIAEGYATAASVSKALQVPVAMACDAGNLKPVAESLKNVYPDREVCILADCDGTGWRKGRLAAEAVDGIAIAPLFAPGEEALTDWNDLANKSLMAPKAIHKQLAKLDDLVGRKHVQLRMNYAHLDKDEAIMLHPELEPLYKFIDASKQFVNDNINQFDQENNARFMALTREMAFGYLAKGLSLPVEEVKKHPQNDNRNLEINP